MCSNRSLACQIQRAPGGALAVFVLASILCPISVAQTPELNPSRPDVYTVVKGDTLWDISARFLREPWLWPEIWEANPQIKNPHLIYPGDEVSLAFVSGRPVLRVRRGGRPTVKLQPRIRVERREFRAIPTIPIDAISQFLSRPRIVAEGDLNRAPYIVSVGKEHLVAGAGYRVFARGFGDSDLKRYTVFRQGATYFDPDSEEKEILGFEALHVADAVVEASGDPATLRLTRSSREVLIGDRMLPVDDSAIEQDLLPRAPEVPIKGKIIQVVEGVTQIGQYQVVVLNRGSEHGLEPGHVMAVYQTGATIIDELAPRMERQPPPEVELPPGKTTVGPSEIFHSVLRFGREIESVLIPNLIDSVSPRVKIGEPVTLPDERAGIIIVFRTFGRISYALVMKASRPMHLLDTVTNP